MKNINHKIFVLIFLSCFTVLHITCKSSAVPVNGTGSWHVDSEKFASDYPLVGRENVFAYRSPGEIINILKHGTGVVFLGFKECPWCQAYSVYLNEAARETGINIIFYFDIRDERQNNSDNYLEMVSILSESLQYDDEGRKRIFVPDVTIINNGEIIVRDYETSKDTLGFQTPEEYWTDERISALKTRLRAGMGRISKTCDCDY